MLQYKSIAHAKLELLKDANDGNLSFSFIEANDILFGKDVYYDRDKCNSIFGHGEKTSYIWWRYDFDCDDEITATLIDNDKSFPQTKKDFYNEFLEEPNVSYLHGLDGVNETVDMLELGLLLRQRVLSKLSFRYFTSYEGEHDMDFHNEILYIEPIYGIPTIPVIDRPALAQPKETKLTWVI